ncbi:MAG: hypothetical protein KF764_11745 [Labilithrix sp.]|nr:hypothetical protein [Labilithrix sp.]
MKPSGAADMAPGMLLFARVRSSLRSVGLVGALALAAAGCGGPGAKSPKGLAVPNPFPTKSALESVARAPLKSKARRAVASVPEWRVDPSDIPDVSPAEARLVELSPAVKELTFTRELRCIARELGRLRAEHGADADERVQRFIVGACGRTGAAGVSTFYLTGDAPAEVSDDELLKAWKGQVALPASFKGKSAGAWLTRKGKQAVLMIVGGAGESDVTLSRNDTPGVMTVRGTAPADVEEVIALVNRGADGVARCEPNRTATAPQFAFDCKLDDDDPWAWIEVLSRRSGRVLLRATALLIARRDPLAPVELTRGAASSAPHPPDVVTAILEGVNRARANAKLAPLAPAPKQAEVNARLASHFFDAEATADSQTADVVALGLLAGWDVGGTIRNGSFFGTMLTGAKGAASWIDYALEHPMGRFTLLVPEARQIAVGPTTAEGAGLGVVITTYSFFGAEDDQANATRVMNRIAQERAARGLAPATAFGNLPGLVNAARLVNAGKREPMAALDEALGAEAQRIGQSLRGWVLVTHDLDSLDLPKELLAPGPVAVRVVVTHYQPENIPWGAYLIYFVSPAPTPREVATKASFVASAR